MWDEMVAFMKSVSPKDGVGVMAYKRVRRNHGAAGIDGMTVEEALPWLKEHREELLHSIRDGSYMPSPVRRSSDLYGGKNPEAGWRRAKAGDPYGSRTCDSAGNRTEAAKPAERCRK